MTRFVFFVVTLILGTLLWAQKKCGTKAPTSGEFEDWISNKIGLKLSRTRSESRSLPIYQIPVVIHILHQGEAIGVGSNLSKERVLGQIDSLNADFRRLNADAVNTPSEFQSVATDSEVEFVLAKQNPKGDPTDGIVRVSAFQSFDPVDESDLITMRRLSFWPADSYLNIYVTNLVSAGFDLIGSAMFPETSLEGIPAIDEGLFLDAVFVDYDCIFYVMV